MIPHSKVVLDQDDIAKVINVLRSGQLVQGEAVSSFEKKMASYVGVKYAVAVSSGTAALHISLLCLGIGAGSEIIIPSYVCTALLNAVHYVRAKPVLVDIDPYTYNMDVEKIRNALNSNTRAIIVPHMFGLPADMDVILSFGIPVIEDCAQSIGAKLDGKYVGSLGVMSIFSCYATKMLCAGEGGFILSNDRDLAEKARDLRDYDEKEDYTIRFNYKLSDIQAALGESQLKKLPASIQRRQEIAKIYNSEIEGIVSFLPTGSKDREHIYYRYVISMDDPVRFMAEMQNYGIECKRPVFKPLHRYLDLSGYPATEDSWAKAVSIPIYSSLTEKEVLDISAAMREFLGRC